MGFCVTFSNSFVLQKNSKGARAKGDRNSLRPVDSSSRGVDSVGRPNLTGGLVVEDPDLGHLCPEP